LVLRFGVLHNNEDVGKILANQRDASPDICVGPSLSGTGS
jgi:hypothetical protein